MNITPHGKGREAFSLLMVLIMIGVGCLLLGSVLQWSSATSELAGRDAEFSAALAAAEAATEKVIARMASDYWIQGAGGVDSSLGTYVVLYPDAGEMNSDVAYEFSGPGIGINRTLVTKLSDWEWSPLRWKYAGFSATNATYRIVSNARPIDSTRNVVGALKQEVQLAALPIFEFAIFYGIDLEFHPTFHDYVIGGRVHCNSNIYCRPDARTVTFEDHVTASGSIRHENHPADSQARAMGTVNYLGEKDSAVKMLTLPGMTNWTQMLEWYSNRANVIIQVTDSGVDVRAGPAKSPVPDTAFVRMDGGTNFNNARENRSIQFSEIDVLAMRNNGTLSGIVGSNPWIVFASDVRTLDPMVHQAGVRLINGQDLPAAGLTLVSPQPLYVLGHFNAPPAHLGTTNTTLTAPASLVGDSLTVLSTGWSDANSTNYLAFRPADNTTINAAILVGITPSAGVNFSGGLENVPRLLEDWSGRTLTINGSFVVLFPSAISTAPWDPSEVYFPPIRQFSFDPNFRDPGKLPPGTPLLRTVIRDRWAIAQPNSAL